MTVTALEFFPKELSAELLGINTTVKPYGHVAISDRDH